MIDIVAKVHRDGEPPTEGYLIRVNIFSEDGSTDAKLAKFFGSSSAVSGKSLFASPLHVWAEELPCLVLALWLTSLQKGEKSILRFVEPPLVEVPYSGQ